MEAIAVAVVAAVGVVLAALVQAGRKENKSDHGVVADLLRGLHSDVKNVDSKLEGHIKQHGDLKKPVAVKK
jgi:hypothetical protein